MKRLLFVVVDPYSFLLFRVPIALAARNNGYEVHIASMPSPDREEIERLGFIHHDVALNRRGTNLIKEAISVWSIFRLLRKIKPDIVHLITIKPVIYGAIAAKFARISGVVAAVSGLGRIFIAEGCFARIRRQLVKWLYRVALDNDRVAVIFQNSEDFALVKSFARIGHKRAFLIDGGSGVDLSKYQMTPEPAGAGVILFAGRLLKDKGILDFVEAARILKRRGAGYRFVAAGSIDPGNPATLTENEIQNLQGEGIVEFSGFSKNIQSLIAQANIVTLPSYREGFPKVLVEAAACGRATVTTDVAGCRQAIEPGVTGMLVPVRAPEALAEAFSHLMENGIERLEMGRRGRLLAEQRFDIQEITRRHLEIYMNLLR